MGEAGQADSNSSPLGHHHRHHLLLLLHHNPLEVDAYYPYYTSYYTNNTSY